MLDELRLPIRDVKLPEFAGRIGRILHRGRWYEQEMLDFIRSLELGGTYVDVGANLGNHSVYFALNTRAERVIAFEPIPKALRSLRAFISLNDLEAVVTVVPCACSDFNGEVSVTENAASDVAPVVYACKTIDTLIRTPVSVMKLDIEGAEAAALRGARALLGRCKPVLFVEIHDDQHMDAVLSVIAPLGYRATNRVFNASPTYEFRVEA